MTDLFARPSPRLDRAFQIANIVHAGAVRKGTEIPYIKHPIAVAQDPGGPRLRRGPGRRRAAARHGRGCQVRQPRPAAAAERCGRTRPAGRAGRRVGVQEGVPRVPAATSSAEGVRPGDGGHRVEERRQAAPRLARAEEGTARSPGEGGPGRGGAQGGRRAPQHRLHARDVRRDGPRRARPVPRRRAGRRGTTRPSRSSPASGCLPGTRWRSRCSMPRRSSRPPCASCGRRPSSRDRTRRRRCIEHLHIWRPGEVRITK